MFKIILDPLLKSMFLTTTKGITKLEYKGVATWTEIFNNNLPTEFKIQTIQKILQQTNKISTCQRDTVQNLTIKEYMQLSDIFKSSGLKYNKKTDTIQ